jgi:hypothetical protein
MKIWIYHHCFTSLCVCLWQPVISCTNHFTVYTNLSVKCHSLLTHNNKMCEIWRFHGFDYEDCCLLECDTVYSENIFTNFSDGFVPSIFRVNSGSVSGYIKDGSFSRFMSCSSRFSIALYTGLWPSAKHFRASHLVPRLWGKEGKVCCTFSKGRSSFSHDEATDSFRDDGVMVVCPHCWSQSFYGFVFGVENKMTSIERRGTLILSYPVSISFLRITVFSYAA